MANQPVIIKSNKYGLIVILDAELGFEELKLHRIEARFIQGNERSRRVMEKVGMRFEGIMREGMRIKGNYLNIGICSILQSEWREIQEKKALD